MFLQNDPQIINPTICYKFVRTQGKDKYCPVRIVCVVCISVTPEKVYRSETFTATISIGVFFHWWNSDHVDSEIPSHCKAICTTKVITSLQLGRCLVLCSTVTIHIISALSFQHYHAYFIYLLSYIVSVVVGESDETWSTGSWLCYSGKNECYAG